MGSHPLDLRPVGNLVIQGDLPRYPRNLGGVKNRALTSLVDPQNTSLFQVGEPVLWTSLVMRKMPNGALANGLAFP